MFPKLFIGVILDCVILFIFIIHYRENVSVFGHSFILVDDGPNHGGYRNFHSTVCFLRLTSKVLFLVISLNFALITSHGAKTYET